MGRKPDAVRRAELLAGFVDYIMKRGLADLSLRPAAAALKTSPQVLLYHFRSKDELLTEAIREVRARHEAVFANRLRVLAKKTPSGRATGPLQSIWGWYTGPHHLRYMRFFYQVYGLAIGDPKRFRKFLDLIGADHRSFLEAGLVTQGHPPGPRTKALATFYYAAFRGLLLDLLTTHERSRIDAAVAELDRTIARSVHDREEESEPPSPRVRRAAAPNRRSRAGARAKGARRRRPPPDGSLERGRS